MQAAVAIPDEDERLVVHSATQSIDSVQSTISKVLGVSSNKVSHSCCATPDSLSCNLQIHIRGRGFFLQLLFPQVGKACIKHVWRVLQSVLMVFIDGGMKGGLVCLRTICMASGAT